MRWPRFWRATAPDHEPPLVWETIEPALTPPPAEAAADAARALAALAADECDENAPDWLAPWSPSAADEATPTDDDILGVLHREYLATLRDPLHGLTTLTQPANDSGPRNDPADAFEQLQAQGRQHACLYAVMGEADAIEPVLAALDSGLPGVHLEAEPEDDVLRLFAPAELRAPISPQDSWLALVAAEPTAAPSAPPELNRREHHAITLDSGLPILPTPPRS